MVLKAKEMLTNRSLAIVLGFSRCMSMVSKMNILASSTSLPALYVNYSRSIKGSTGWVMGFLTIFSIAFITKEVNTLVEPFL